MFIEERHQAILDLLAKQGSVTTAQIQKTFDISYDSAKRDLRLLEEQGKLRRTHGGAIPLGELSIGRARTMLVQDDNSDTKSVIKYAISLISEGDVIFIPSGELGVMMAKMLPDMPGVHAVTNSIVIAEILRHMSSVSVTFCGGEIDKDGTAMDAFTCEMIRRFRFDKAFITSDGISVPFGLSVKQMQSLLLYSAVIDSSRRAIGLYSAAAIDADASVSVCPVSRLDALLCVGKITAKTRSAFEKCGVTVVICE